MVGSGQEGLNGIFVMCAYVDFGFRVEIRADGVGDEAREVGMGNVRAEVREVWKICRFAEGRSSGEKFCHAIRSEQ